MRFLTSLLLFLQLTASSVVAHVSQVGCEKVFEGGFDATLSAGVQTAAHGGDFGEAFKGSFINSVVALGLADAQTGIGDVFSGGQNGGEGSLGHVMLHAGLRASEQSA